MQSSLIGKIEKSRIYATERDRFEITDFSCQVRGDNSHHGVTFQDGAWRCDCQFFEDYGTCSHVMAAQRVLDGMVPEAATPVALANAS